jgi:CubicO group peptidase (beta-lactamase class C family)
MFSAIPYNAYSSDKPLADLVRKQVQPLLKEGRVIGAVTLVAQKGKVLDLQAHGMRDKASGNAMQTDSIFRIHSFSKSITSTAALILYEAGNYTFDEPIERWIPAFAGSGIQVQHLFTHSSGISYAQREAFKAGNLEAVVNELAKEKRSFEPGEGWSYGASIDILGRLIEIWSADGYADFLHKRIIKPLGMKDTAFFVPEEKRSRLATLYLKGKKGEAGLQATADWNERGDAIPAARPLLCMPGGGLFSTAADYARFLMMIQNDGEWAGVRYLKPETVVLMRSDQLADSAGWVRFGKQVRDGFRYGYGFNVVTQKSKWSPESRVGEFGWGGKCSCHYWMHPMDQLVLITLEQTLPYNWNMEEALKGPIYAYFGH